VWAIVRDGVPILEQGYGYSDRERGIRFSATSPFPPGSIPKQFTATAILMLQDQGRLSVHDPISKFFPQAPADKPSITLHHLLT
jgi:CubicO group peptidase (beta-lactamase class C family)